MNSVSTGKKKNMFDFYYIFCVLLIKIDQSLNII